MTKPLLTVSMPAYRAGKIMWLALEGLCAQEEAPPWELLISEERREAFGKERLEPYVERLQKAGCVQVHYEPLEERIVLARKWRRLAQRSAPSSRVFVLHGADDYSHPERLAETWEAFEAHKDHDPPAVWAQYPKGYFYSIADDALALFDYHSPGYAETKHTAVNMAARTDLVRQCAPADYATGVDGWLYGEALTAAGGVGCKVEIDEDSGWACSLFTDGFNVCSLPRASAVVERRTPFLDPRAGPFGEDVALYHIVPSYIADRLLDLRREALATALERQLEAGSKHIVEAIRMLRRVSS